MSNVVDKLLGYMGFEVEEVEEDSLEEEMSKGNMSKSNIVKERKKNNIVSLPTSQKSIKMVVTKPHNFDQVQAIADHLKNRRPVIVNLEETQRETAKRIIDFLSGTTYALAGSMQKVSNSIMLFVPSNVDVSGDLISEFTERNIFSLDDISTKIN